MYLHSLIISLFKDINALWERELALPSPVQNTGTNHKCGLWGLVVCSSGKCVV
jgi:hypothetical protein